jgi:NAD(P)-dependent dehydrogenase (short-subunit alcohol dehydrogenase family)
MSEARVVLVTGASSGIGQATASLLVDHGFRVYGTSRKPRSDKADGIEMLRLDVTSDESVSACFQTLMQRACRLDVLVNNAGYGLFGAVEETSIQEAKAQLETNFFGAVRMVRAALPIMRQQKGGQIINISSVAGVFGNPFNAFYSASKHALEGYTEALRHEVKHLNINVSLVEPGFFKTNITNASPECAESIDCYNEVRGRLRQFYEESIEKGPDPRQVAETILKIVESESPRLRYAVGKEKRYIQLRNIFPESITERVARRQYRLDG